MKLPLYEIQPETKDSRPGYRVCLSFNGDLLPLPNQWFRSEEVALLRIAKLQREDFAMWQQENHRGNL